MNERISHLEKLLIGLFLVVLCWLPLPLGSNRDWSMGLLVALIGGVGCLWSLLLVMGQVRMTQALRAALPMTGLLLLAQVWVAIQWQTGLSMDVGATFQRLMLGLAYTLLFLVTVSLFHSRKRLVLLLSVLIVSGTFQGFYGAYMHLSGTAGPLAELGYDHSRNATGSYANRNHLAGYLEMTLACGIGLLMALRDDQKLTWRSMLELLMGPKARLRIALVIMVIALVMTRSRMGNTAFFASLLIVGGIFCWRDKAHRKRNLLVLASILLIDLLVISQFFGLERLKDRMVNTRMDAVEQQGQLISAGESRDEVFSYALELAKERPLTGQGAGAFEVTFPHVSGPDIRHRFVYAHNDYLQFFIEYGAAGTLPLMLFVLMALYHVMAAVWQRDSTFRSGVGFGALMAILAIGIHSLVDFNLQIPANAATFVVICAVAVLARYPGSRRHPRSRHGSSEAVAGA